VNRASAYLAQNAPAAWALIGGVVLVFATGIFWGDVEIRTQQRQILLETDAQRSGLELMSTTLNGNLMGSVTLLGLLDGDIKQEASNGLVAEDANVAGTMSIVGNAFAAEGVFVVGMDGIVKSSWDRVNKSSTGLDVRFRPYFQMAMRGQSSVYAAVSMARGDRSLYFSAPVFPEHAHSTVGVGAIVARTTLDRVDSLLLGKYDVALLLSPQGVVFAGNRDDWIGRLAGVATPERLHAIRELKQFGAMFENQAPLALPLEPTQGVQQLGQHSYVVAVAPVRWNDPAGDWSLIVAEDLGRTTPVAASAWRAVGGAMLVLLLGWMWLRLLRVRHSQELASAHLQVYASEQEQQARYRTHLGALSLRLQHSEEWATFATTFFQSAREMVGVVQGTLYVTPCEGSDQVLVLAGSAACAHEPQPLLYLGEGLLGQCALERSARVIAMPPDGVWNLRSGLGATPMAALLLAPLVMQDILIGTVEMGLLTVPNAQQRQQLDELVSLLANHLEIHRRSFELQAPSLSNELVEVPA
jgi:two-component system, NtrC family, C4-dicarboxylate transport sensor histidine kinase DctB